MVRFNSRIYTLAVAMLAIGLLVGAGFSLSLVKLKADESKPPVTGGAMTPLIQPHEAVMPSATQLSSAFNAVSKAVQPVVVNINTSQKVRMQQGFQMFPFGDDFPFGFGNNSDRRDRQYKYDDRGNGDEGDSASMQQKSLGSGIIVDPRGYILTNYHVVEKADKIEVFLADVKKTITAKVVGKDKVSDLAVIKIDLDQGLPYARFGNSDETQVGDWVLAFGSPFNFPQTVTAGIISAKGRNLDGGPLENFIQTDASINPGNSGGPLVNMRGEVIGVNTAIVTPNQGNIGIGFAIPSNSAKSVMEQLINTGKVVRGWLGVSVQEVTPAMVRNFKLKDDKGAMIADVSDPKSPAAKAGLKTGDVIVEFNGTPIASRNKLVEIVTATDVGKKTVVKFYRDGKLQEADVTITERNLPDEQSETPEKREEHGRLGVSIDNLTPQMARRLRTNSEDGAVIMDIDPGSAADRAGLQQYDIIHEINRQPTKTAKDLTEAIKNTKSGDEILLSVERDGGSIFISVALD